MATARKTNSTKATTTTKPVRLVRLRIEGFRGHHEFDIEIPADGIAVRGCNESGKTSILASILALCDGRSCKPRDVANGAPAAIIQGWLQTEDGTEYQARRRISPDGGSTITVRGPGGVKGEQELMTELVGSPSAFDPARFLDLPTDEQVVRAGKLFPCEVTPAWLEAHGIDPRGVDLSGHGLAVLDRLYSDAYARRALANAAALKARQDAADSAQDAEGQAEKVPLGAGTVKAAEQAIVAAQRALDTLAAQADQAAKAEARGAKTRERIAALKAQAAEKAQRADASAPAADSVQHAQGIVDERQDRVRGLREALTRAEEELRVAVAALASTVAARNTVATLLSESAALLGQASDLEATLAAASAPPPAPEDLAAAATALDQARAAKAAADLADAAAKAQAQANRDRATAEKADAEAKRLDDLVKFLSREAPAELMAESNILPGLGITSKGLTLDSGRGPVPLEICSTKQRWELAVKLACLASPRLLLVTLDDFEHFDPDNQMTLIRAVQESGRTLVLTEVQRGTITVSPLPATTADATEDLFA